MDDIKVTRSFDELRNERVIIIYGVNDLEHGEIDIISSEDKNISYYHSIYFKIHGEIKYLDDSNYQNSLKGASLNFQVGNLIFIQNYKYNNIIFTETTPDECDVRYGILYLPVDRPSEVQFEKLKELIDRIKDFNEIMVFGIPQVDLINRSVDNGFSFVVSKAEILNLVDIINKEYDVFGKTKKGR